MWSKDNPPPIRRNKNLERIGSKHDCAERIITTYIETGRSVRSLAMFYGCSKSTIGRYIKDYAKDSVSSYLYRVARQVAKEHLGSGANDVEDCGSLD